MTLWDNFCPKFDWVAPESGTTTGNGYLKKHWNRETSIHAINFRQFAFLSSDFTLGTGEIKKLSPHRNGDRREALSEPVMRGFFVFQIISYHSDSLYYHCFIKVCPKNEEATCSKKDLNNDENTCSAPTYYNDVLSGRKRRNAQITLGRSGKFSYAS